MHRLLHRFTRLHGYIFLGFYVAFATLTYLALKAGSECDQQVNNILGATLGVVSGPFTGAIARHFQSCCQRFSLALFPYCAAFLAAGVLFQMVPVPFQRFERTQRLTLWSLGLLGWFGGYKLEMKGTRA